MNPDFVDFLEAPIAADIRFIVVGAHALAARRIDILTEVTGLRFDRTWNGRVGHQVELLAVPFLGRDDLVRNKRSAGRYKDLGDLEALGEDPHAP